MLKRIRKLLGRRSKTQTEATVADTRGRPEVHKGPQAVHRPISHEDLDPDALKIVQRLTRFDHKAYLVGGCVRDLLLDRKPKDFDIGTSATPRQIKRLFRNCRIIGRRFRLAHIYFQKGKIIEVATFRARDEPDTGEGETADLLIRDDNVFGTPEEDALRRDFTINALFYDVNGEAVIDHADGLSDLRSRLVRTIGRPEIRFREDPIRSLRAIKFAARLEFSIEKETLAALRKTRTEIQKAAPPRVLEEINRFCREGATQRSFALLHDTELLEVILPELAETYKGKSAEWRLLLELLGRMDRRHAHGPEVRTGEIFAALLLPTLPGHFGWKADGTVEQRRINPRTIVDDALRPIALRLRVPRREQELCRQILTTLARMVPAQRIRPSTKRAILGRECLGDALWILEGVAANLGGEFAEALEFWRAATSAQPQRSPSADAPSGRRRSRRRSGAKGASPAGTPGKPARPREDLPDPRDDGYFFAALPSVPEIAKDDGKADRYGAAALAAVAGPAETAPVETDKPRRRRRRRRRRGGGGGGGGGGEGGEGSEPAPEGGDG